MPKNALLLMQASMEEGLFIYLINVEGHKWYIQHIRGLHNISFKQGYTWLLDVL